MVTILKSGAVMNIELPVILLLLATWKLETTLVYGAGIASEHYSAATGTTAVGPNGGRYASTGDSNTANTFTKYLKGYSHDAGMNGFAQQQQDSSGYQTDYGSGQPRYAVSDGNSEEQQSHISAGYHHPQSGTYHYAAASENSYETPHQGDNDKLTRNTFSHQYEQEFSGSSTGDGGGSDAGGYYSANEFEGPSSEYQHSHEDFTATHQHQHTDVINYVPYPVVKKLHVPYSKAVQIPISHAVIIPVRKPVPIHIPITKQIQVPVEKELKIPVERLVPYPVEKPVPVPVEKHVPYTVVKYMPVRVPKPYAVKVPVVRTIVHKVKQLW